jgi:hypothetical protein
MGDKSQHDYFFDPAVLPVGPAAVLEARFISPNAMKVMRSANDEIDPTKAKLNSKEFSQSRDTDIIERIRKFCGIVL